MSDLEIVLRSIGITAAVLAAIVVTVLVVDRIISKAGMQRR